MNFSGGHAFIGIYKLQNILPPEGTLETIGEPRKPSIRIILVPNKVAHPWNIELVAELM